MTKKILGILICTITILLIPAVNGMSVDVKSEESTSSFGYTFIIGTVYNPIESGETVNASAIRLVYYEWNFMDENIGMVGGFKQISFKRQPFFNIYKPGPFGLVAYVFGFCTDFEILE
ncbi:MAG: hypothetical protein U9R21_08285 [Candidatus Thermoplasmatota archaeon]|nr:hypothetical protein [Candidatus Thermoplasmatota archaeon]